MAAAAKAAATMTAEILAATVTAAIPAATATAAKVVTLARVTAATAVVPSVAAMVADSFWCVPGSVQAAMVADPTRNSAEPVLDWIATK